MLAAFLVCAATAVPQVEPFKPTAVYRGSHSAIKKERYELIEDAAAWKKLWDEHRGTDRSFTETEQDFDVDFDTCRVVCVFTGGVRPTIMGTVVVNGTIHIRYDVGSNDFQFRPEPFVDQPEPLHDSKAEDRRYYMFVVVPKGKMPVVVKEYFRTGRTFKWIPRFPAPPKK
jgi:hypothetical protein